MSELATMSSDLFTKHLHHQNLTVLYIEQNIFNNTKNHRASSLNANYIVLFTNQWDKAQVLYLAHQKAAYIILIVSEKAKKPPGSNDAAEPYSCLMMDVKHYTSENLMLHVRIFSGEAKVVYVPKT